jgi:calcium-dependent protein kinase
MESLHEMQDRLEGKVGVIQISGRYHRFPRNLSDDYACSEKVLGTGFNGNVLMAEGKDRRDSKGELEKFAVKAFDFTGVPAARRSQLESEVEVFLSMDHPHIARLVDVYERDLHMDLVMECMEGGELLDRIREKKRFSEQDTACHVWQMLLALNYIHRHGMIHCDLKLENFMYDHVGGNHLKLIDFGFSKMCDKKAELRRKACGTLSYTAPEVLDWSYTQSCDQWSLGVIVFVLLAGYMPFSGPQDEQMKKIASGTFTMKPERWSTISEDAKNFTRGLLQVDPKKRLTADLAIQHPFMKLRPYGDETPVDAGIIKALRDYGQHSRFRRCCLIMMAWSLSREEREKVEKYFLALDSKHEGAIGYDQLKKVMVDQYHLSSKDVKESFQALDSSHHKEIHFSDFLAAMIDGSHLEIKEDLLHEAFRKFDTDTSGYITAENLRCVLGDTFEGHKVEKLLNEADTLHHGKLSYHEFASYLKCNHLRLHGDEACGELPIFENPRNQTRCGSSDGKPCCNVQ